MPGRVGPIALLLCALCACATSSGPPPKTDACAGLAASGEITFESVPSWQSDAALPRYCKVRGTISNRIQFEYRLPEQWNGRFLMAGCGGFCGALLPDKPGRGNAINYALERGYAAISHDGGHQAPNHDTSWAYKDPEALEIWAHKVLPMVVEAGTEVARQFYGRVPDYRYFSGCSNGGRLGLVAAQRYPELFDGIAAGGSIFDLSGTAGLWGNWMIQQLHQPEAALAAEQVPLLKQAVMAQCDALDGQKDGIIAHPPSCRFDFNELQCPPGQVSGADCISSAQANALNRLYGGVQKESGETIYPAVAFGSEHYMDIWLVGSDTQPAWGVLASEGYRQLLSHQLFGSDAPAAISTDEMLDWIERSHIPALTNAIDPDLSGLAANDTKLMIYHGWSDPLIIPQPTVDYYENAAANSGGMEQLQQHARLFMIPGWGHCWERPAEAPDQFDPLQVLEAWVERGEALSSLVAEQQDKQGTLVRSRPVCAYPKVAQYNGFGDVNKAENYHCAEDPGIAAQALR